MFIRQLTLARTREFKLRPIKDVELPESAPRMECETVDLGIFSMAMGEDWRMRQGGVLFTIGEYGDFFNFISGYHTAGTTLAEEWDALFGQLRSSQYRKNIVPCMASPWLLRLSIYKSRKTHKCDTVFPPERWLPRSKFPILSRS
jgi:hypothetical protein